MATENAVPKSRQVSDHIRERVHSALIKMNPEVEIISVCYTMHANRDNSVTMELSVKCECSPFLDTVVLRFPKPLNDSRPMWHGDFLKLWCNECARRIADKLENTHYSFGETNGL